MQPTLSKGQRYTIFPKPPNNTTKIRESGICATKKASPLHFRRRRLCRTGGFPPCVIKIPPRTIAMRSDAGREGLLRLIGVWASGNSTHNAADGYRAAGAAFACAKITPCLAPCDNNFTST